MSRSSILLGTFIALLLIAVAILIAPWRPGTTPSGDTAERGAREEVVATLPAVTEEAQAAAASRAEATASSPASEPNRTLRDGRVTMADGGPVPSDLRVVIRNDNPDYFGDMTFAEMMKMGFGRGPARQRELAREIRSRKSVGAGAAVAPDGAFRIEAPASGPFFVDVESETAFVDHWEKRRGEEAAPLAVRAKRGIAVRGKVVSAEGSPIEGADLQWVDRALPRATARMKTPRDIRAKSARDGAFVLRALNPESSGVIAVRHPNYCAVNAASPPGGPPQPFLVTMAPPSRIAGRVVDSAGNPIEAVEVSLLAGDLASYAVGAERDPVKTNAEGRFLILEAAPGRAKVRAEKVGVRPCTSPEFDVKPGFAVDLGILVMQRGYRIEGQVTTPDGAPAPGAQVTLAYSPQLNQLEAGEGGATPSDAAEARTSADGKFGFDGMGKGPYDLEANYPGFAAGRKKRYLADGAPVALKLRRPGAVDLAVAWPSTAAAPPTIEAVLEVSRTVGPGFTLAEPAQKSKFKVPAGAANASFRIEDAAPGTYGLLVNAPGFSPARVQSVDVKGSGAAAVKVELVPGVTARGVVIDRVTKRRIPAARVSLSGTFFDLMRGHVPATDADDDGAFELADLEAGPLSLAGVADGYSREIVSLGELAPGARVEGIEIALGAGGTLEGIVFDEDGFPMAGGIAMANAIEKGEFQQVVLDGDGRFKISHLSAGNYQVTILRGSFLADVSGSNPSDMMKGMQIATAVIKEGETTRIVVGTDGGGMVKVRARVHSRGEPVAGALVSAIPQQSEKTGATRARFSTTDEQGRFQTSLPSGKVVFTIQRGAGSQTGIEQTIEIPNAPTFEVEIAMPQGKIAGNVRGPGGGPLAAQPVFLATDRGAGATLLGSFGQAVTDEDGNYRFENLAPGAYLVSAGGVNAFADGGGEAFGRMSRNVALEDGQTAAGIDFSLAKAGAIVGTVTSRGEPLGGASIFLQTPAGQAVSRLSDVFSNGSGTFRARGIAPGNYRLLARAKGYGFRVIEPVVVETGRDTSVAIALDPGVVVTVQVTDSDGKPVPGTNVDLFDDRSRRLSGFAGIAEFADLFTQGTPPPGTIRLGELGPGRYKIRVARSGYSTVEQDFSVAGEAPVAVPVRLEKS